MARLASAGDVTCTVTSVPSMVVKRIGVSFISSSPYVLVPMAPWTGAIIRGARAASACLRRAALTGRRDAATCPAILKGRRHGRARQHGTAIGFIGVGLLLLAFVLNLAKILKAEGIPYLALNLVGAVLACVSSWMIDFMPFVILESTWTGATLVALVRTLTGRATQPS